MPVLCKIFNFYLDCLLVYSIFTTLIHHHMELKKIQAQLPLTAQLLTVTSQSLKISVAVAMATAKCLNTAKRFQTIQFKSAFL